MKGATLCNTDGFRCAPPILRYPNPHQMSLKSRINADVKTALKSGDKARLKTLRMALAAVKQREVDERVELDDAGVLAALEKMIKQRRDSAEQYRKGAREDLASKEESEIRILDEYLPAPATEADVDAAIDAAMAETGATSPKQMGAVMKALTARLAGRRVDGKAVSDKVRARLSG